MPYIPGDNWVICDVCGLRYRASIMKKRWDTLIVCPHDYEERHPQDFVRGKIDKIAADIARPEPDYVFIDSITTTDDL